MYYYDKPIKSLCEDSLGRASFAKLLAQTLFNLKNTDTFSIGLYGKWGSGKTSILNMALQELNTLQENSPDKIVVVHFEPWHFSDSKQLLNQFIIRLANEFSSKKDKAMNKIGKALEAYSGAFSFAELIPIAGAPISSFGQGLLANVGKRMQNDIAEKDVLQQKNEVIKLLEAQKTKILVVIDDIDRLNNEQIRQIFQLVSAVAKFPNTAYLLVFDKDIVVKALNKIQEGSGEDYLHKIIQMPIQIPDIKEAELHKTLFNSLDQIIEEFETPFHLERWKSLFIPCISPFLSNLRDVNRLLNSIKFKLTTISSEIEFSDMVSICAIEIGAPEIFEWIKNNKNILVGDPDISSVGTHRYTQADWLKIYTDKLNPLVDERVQIKGYAKSRVETVLNALAHLFPSFGGKIGKGSNSVSAETARKNCYICNTDKFDRYFDLDVDNIFITRAIVKEVVFSYRKNKLEEFFVEKNLNGQLYELLEEIRAMLPDLKSERLNIVFEALMSSIYRFSSNDSRGFLGQSTAALAEYLTFETLNAIPTSERYTSFTDALQRAYYTSIESFAHIINMLELAYGRWHGKGQERTEIEKAVTEDELIEIEKTFTEQCKKILSKTSLFDFPRWRMTLHLLNYFDSAFIDEYMVETLVADVSIVKYIFDISSMWRGSGISFEINKPPYKYVTPEKIIAAIDNLIASEKLFELEQDVQERAAAFYLDHLGKVSYDGHITQRDAIAFLEEKKKHKFDSSPKS